MWQPAIIALRDRLGLLARRAKRRPAVAFVLAVQERYAALRGSSTAARISLDGLIALFALLVLTVAVLGFVSSNSANVARDLVRDLGLPNEFERIINESVDAARRSRRVTTAVGIVVLVVAATNLAVAVASAYNAAWRVEGRGLVDRARGIAWLLGGAVLMAAGGLATAGWRVLPGEFAPLVLVTSITFNTALWLWTSWLLPNRRAPLRAMLVPAVLGAIAVEILKVIGAFYVPRLVHNTSALYGTIGVTFALLLWLLIVGRIVVYVTVLEVFRYERRHGTEARTISVPTPWRRG